MVSTKHLLKALPWVFLYKNIWALPLIVTYVNDLQETDPISNADSYCLKEFMNDCFAGAARHATVLMRIRRQHKRSIFIFNGHSFFGSLDYIANGLNVMTDVAKYLKPDVVMPGKLEWVIGFENISTFIKEVGAPCPLTNLDRSHYTDLIDEFKPHVIIQRENLKIGVLGFLPQLLNLVFPDTLHLLPELEALEKECKVLERHKVDYVVVVTNVYLDEMLKYTRISCLDLLIQTERESFMYSGAPPSFNRPLCEHPRIEYPNGRRVAIVGSTVHAQYLGYVEVDVQPNSSHLYKGNPHFLCPDVAQDQNVVKILEKYRPAKDKFKTDMVGSSKVFINSKHCKHRECTYGNLVTDALVAYYAVEKYQGKFWTDTSICIIDLYNMGRNFATYFGTGVSRADLLLLNYHHTDMATLIVPGHNIMEAFNYFCANHIKEARYKDLPSLQFSGLKVLADLKKEKNQMVVFVKALCAHCEIPTFDVLEPSRMYKILLTHRLAFGFFGFTSLSKLNPLNKNYTDVGFDCVVALEWYLKKYSPVYPMTDNRLRFVLDGAVHFSVIGVMYIANVLLIFI